MALERFLIVCTFDLYLVRSAGDAEELNKSQLSARDGARREELGSPPSAK